MPITLEDIGRMSGVSRSTVSRVINEDPNVSEKTRSRVQDVIRSVNYHPNLAARGLAAGRTKVVGLVIPRGVTALFSDPYFPLVIQGVASACAPLDFSVMLWLSEPEHERKAIGQILHNGLLEGVIITAMLIDDPLIQSLSESKRPFITIGRHPNDETHSYVDVDNRAGAYEAVSHIVRTGHRRVAVINGPENTAHSWERYHGYQKALRDRGLPLVPALIAAGDFSEAGGYLAAKRLLVEKPDAVFACSDAMAFGCMRAIREAGLRIPEDVAVVGFDDIPTAANSKPPLTTVRQPIQRIGSLAAEMLIEMIEHPDPQPRRVVLPTELIVRSSC